MTEHDASAPVGQGEPAGQGGQGWPDVTVGVITHPGRRDAFAKLLEYLGPAAERYPGEVFLCVGNNGGADDGASVRAAVEAAPLAGLAGRRVVDSSENNIAIGRNLVFDSVSTRLVAFIDDDEYPRVDWLATLVDGWRRLGVAIVAGPILPVYPPGTPHWIQSIDVHNVRGRETGDAMEFVASGNFLADLDAIGSRRLDPRFGKSGGSDTEFFLRIAADGIRIRWVAEAIVDEDIPADKATTAYTLRRCLSQGANHRRIMTERGRIGSPLAYTARSVAVAALAAGVALPLVAAGHPRAGDWVKRSVSNLGKLKGPGRPLYR